MEPEDIKGIVVDRPPDGSHFSRWFAKGTTRRNGQAGPKVGTLKQSAGSPGRLIPELDGVRGIAVLVVMLDHNALMQGLPRSLHNLHLQSLLGLGWSGVDLFFVLSGFLISGILLDTHDSKNYFSSFYARRVLRIFPLYFISVLAYFHLALPLAHHFGQWPSFTGSLEIWFWLHLSNWKLAFGEDAYAINHFWSLAIEEQFYLFWPIVVFLAGRRWLAYVCLTLIGVSFGLRYFYAHNDFGQFFLYELTPFRLEPLAFGSLAAVLVRNGATLSIIMRRGLLFVIATCGVLMLFAVLLTGRTTFMGGPPMATYGFTAFAIVYTCLVLYAHANSGSGAWLATKLRTPLLRAFGKYSYAIYVFHISVFMAFGKAVKMVSAVLPEQLQVMFWLIALVSGIALSYAVALISWHLVEKHFWGLKRRFAAKY